MNPARRITVVGVKGMILLLALALASCAPAPATRTSTEIPQATKQEVLAAYGKVPLSFEANQGQTDPQVRFLSRGSGYTLFLTPTEAVLTLTKAGAHAKRQISGEATLVEPEKHAGTVLRMKLLGANPMSRVTGVEELRGRSNYFIGNDPAKWRANVPTHAKVEYRDVYPGVNLVYYGNQRQLEHDFVVSPGADPKAITLAFEGIDGVAIDALGDLVLRADGSEVRLRKPVVYQEHNGRRAVIPTRYVFKAERQVAFEVAAYDATKPLIIDPVLAYSTYLGGFGEDEGRAIAVDPNCSINCSAYVTGTTNSLNFPTITGAFQTIPGSIFFNDVFVTKLNATGTALVYSTYLGGGGGERGNAIAVDKDGNAYVTGETNSVDFPTTSGAVQTTFGGSFSDAFVTKLNATGTALVYSTYLGGDGDDFGSGIAADALFNAYVTGGTSSAHFPTTTSAFQTSPGGGVFNDAFVTKLNATGTALAYSTYLGGGGGDEGFGIAVDAAGSAYVTGCTGSADFPTLGAFQATFGGGFSDAFVTKFDPGGSALVYSTQLGGLGFDEGRAIAVDKDGNAYVTGLTGSGNFPTTPGAVQTTFAGGGIVIVAGCRNPLFFDADAFVTKLNATGTALAYSTYLGGHGFDEGFGIAVDAAGFTYVTGGTSSPDFPTTPNAVQTTSGGFVTKLNPTGSALVYSTYLGNGAAGIAVDAAGSAYVTGIAAETGFPTTTGAFQTAFGGGFFDAFVAKLSFVTTTPFAAFHARIEIEHERHEREFEVKGTFTLGAGSVGIDPLTEDVTLEVGAFAATIPKGSFRRHGHGTFKFEGGAGGARLEVKIQARGGNNFEFKAEGKGAQVGTATPVAVRLAVGDDAGSTVARVKADDD